MTRVTLSLERVLVTGRAPEGPERITVSEVREEGAIASEKVTETVESKGRPVDPDGGERERTEGAVASRRMGSKTSSWFGEESSAATTALASPFHS